MISGIHILLTYKCTLECDHCFLFSSPRAQGTMTVAQVRSVLEESRQLKSVEWIYFEGGEPFLFYPTMLEGVRLARSMGFKVGIVTNAYGAISAEDAELFWYVVTWSTDFQSILLQDRFMVLRRNNDDLFERKGGNYGKAEGSY